MAKHENLIYHVCGVEGGLASNETSSWGHILPAGSYKSNYEQQ